MLTGFLITVLMGVCAAVAATASVVLLGRLLRQRMDKWAESRALRRIAELACVRAVDR